MGVSHWTKFALIALVSDQKAYDDMAKAFGWMIPGKLKAFALADLAEAKAWVVE